MAQSISQGQIQKTSQKQIQKMSQKQIQAVKFLTLTNRDLREEIYKAVEENPALEIVEDVSVNSNNSISSDDYQRALENIEDNTETLQEHLLSQLNSMKIPDDVKIFCSQLIYNLDKNGCFGSSIKPESFLDRSNIYHDERFVEKCMDLVQRLDPIGCCAKNLEESLLIQARIIDDKQTLAIFLLDGHLEFLSPPEPEKVLKKLKDFQKTWHSKAFAPELPIDSLILSEQAVKAAINFILSLNPHPAAGFTNDSTHSGIQVADIALIVERKEGSVPTDDFEKGFIRIDDHSYFSVKTPSGFIPELRIVPLFQRKSEKPEVQAFREKYLNKAQDFLSNLQFRQNTIFLQGCQIVCEQKDFFLKGPGNLKPLTRRILAEKIGVHESTVSRATNKKNPRFIQTEFGIFPLSYFFQSGVSSENSAEKIKHIIKQLEDENEKSGKKRLSDQKICNILNERGIKIARRTVNKYRER